MTNKEKVLKELKKYYKAFEYSPTFTFLAGRTGVTKQAVSKMFHKDPEPFLKIDPTLKKLLKSG